MSVARYSRKPQMVEAVVWNGSDRAIKTLTSWKWPGISFQGEELQWYGIKLEHGIIIFRDMVTHQARIKDLDDFRALYDKA